MPNGEYRQFLETRFNELRTEVHALREDVVTLKTEIASLKVKSGVWGAAMFGSALLVMALFELLVK